MRLGEIVKMLGLEILTDKEGLEEEIAGGYASDLLSDVMAHSAKGSLWVTLQTHQNIVAVAALKELGGIVLVNGRRPDAEAMAKAHQEKVAILTTPLAAFEVAGQLYQAGLRGCRNAADVQS
jgi:predicted transcriptional regulator